MLCGVTQVDLALSLVQLHVQYRYFRILSSSHGIIRRALCGCCVSNILANPHTKLSWCYRVYESSLNFVSVDRIPAPCRNVLSNFSVPISVVFDLCSNEWLVWNLFVKSFGWYPFSCERYHRGEACDEV